MGLGKWVGFGVLCCLATFVTNTAAWAGDPISVVDVPVSKVYVPTVGFDDNDAVEVVVEGRLPNPCYTLGKTLIGPSVNGVISVRQIAWKANEAPCSPGLNDDAVPFTSIGQVGQLRSGSYKVQFIDPSGSLKQTDFGVERAESKSIDNFDYAAVENIDAKDIFYEEDEVIVTLTGVWTTRCQKLQEPVHVEQQGDLFLVLPVITTISERCERVPAPFMHKISLGKPKMGTYLVHSRSRGGKAIYRSMQVWPRVQ